MSFVSRYPIFLSNEPILHGFPFVAYVLIEAHLVVFGIPSQIQFQLGFSFINFNPGCSDNISVFLPVTHPYFHPLYASFFVFQFG